MNIHKKFKEVNHMFIDTISNFVLGTEIETRANRTLRLLAMYTDHGQFTACRNQLGKLKALEHKGIDELPANEFRRMFRLQAPIIQEWSIVLTEPKTEPKTEATPARTTTINDDGEGFKAEPRMRGRPRMNQNQPQQNNTETRIPVPTIRREDKDKKVRVPTKNEVIEISALWDSIMTCLEVEDILAFETSLKKHVVDKIRNTLIYDLPRKNDEQVLMTIARIIARAEALR